MVEQMRERRDGNRHREAAAVGEIRERLTAGRVLLAEDELALRTLGRPPMRDAPLQRAQQPIGVAAGMTALQLVQDRRGAQTRDGLQHRHELLAPNLDEGVLAGAIAPGPVLLAREYRIRFDPAPGALAEPSARCSGSLTVSVPA
jgi:hypothetical protein